jgi:hypothetical protein
MMKITFDTNCFFDYFERDPSLINKIIIFQEKGLVEIAMTTRVMTDTLGKSKVKGHSSIWKKIQGFPLVEVIGTTFRLDMSILDGRDHLVSKEHIAFLDKLHNIINDAQIEDLDHLFGHIMAGRDIFITSDPHFLDHQERLKQDFNAIVLNPKDAVDFLITAFSGRPADNG